ncbi:MAG: TetR/AcrR family transcriptional regulator [Chloroflexota bacterium]|nr:TetR/AcrR family transcriptional regulator [Chloroflexota bacterium]
MSTESVAEKLDRRQRRTRTALRKALMELIIEKSFDAITLQDIVDRADISRATFYLHYKDKEDLLFKSMKDIYDELASKLHGIHNQDEVQKAVATGNHDYFCDPTDFQHVADHADFYRVVLSEQGVASFVVQVRKYLAQVMYTDFCGLIEAGSESRLPADFVAHTLAGAQVGAISWWLEHGKEYTPEQMSRLFYYQMAFGFWWALGAPAGSPPEDVNLD